MLQIVLARYGRVVRVRVVEANDLKSLRPRLPLKAEHVLGSDAVAALVAFVMRVRYGRNGADGIVFALYLSEEASAALVRVLLRRVPMYLCYVQLR